MPPPGVRVQGVQRGVPEPPRQAVPVPALPSRILHGRRTQAARRAREARQPLRRVRQDLPGQVQAAEARAESRDGEEVQVRGARMHEGLQERERREDAREVRARDGEALQVRAVSARVFPPRQIQTARAHARRRLAAFHLRGAIFGGESIRECAIAGE